MGRKTSKKRFFFGCSDKTPGKRFAFLLYSLDDAQTYSIAAQLDVGGVPIIKRGKSIRENIKFWAEKRRKNGFFWGFPLKLKANASQFHCIHPMTLKLTGLLLSWM